MEGRDPATGEVKGLIRSGGAERAPLRFVEVVVNNPKSLSVVATQDPVVAAALERMMARQADEICRYLSAVAVTRTGRRGAQVELGRPGGRDGPGDAPDVPGGRPPPPRPPDAEHPGKGTRRDLEGAPLGGRCASTSGPSTPSATGPW